MFNHLEEILIRKKMKIHLKNNDILLPGRKFFCKTSGKHWLLKRFFFTVTVMPNSFPRSSSCFPLDILYGSSKITNFLSRSDAKLLWDKFLQKKKWGLFVLWLAVSFETKRTTPFCFSSGRNFEGELHNGFAFEVRQWPIHLGRRDSSWYHRCGGCLTKTWGENGGNFKPSKLYIWKILWRVGGFMEVSVPGLLLENLKSEATHWLNLSRPGSIDFM